MSVLDMNMLGIAKFALRDAADAICAAYVLVPLDGEEAERRFRIALHELRDAADALGYDLVKRKPS